jgi:predicted DNA-binding transcriptional regulator AlpA
MAHQILRPAAAAARLGISRSKFWDMVKAGQIKTIKLGPKTTGVISAELDAMIDSLARKRDRATA